MVGSMVNRRIPSVRMWVGLMVGLLGASWVNFVQGHFSDGALLGAVLGFAAIVSLSLGQVHAKLQRLECYPLLVYVIQYTFASFMSVPIALYFRGYKTEWSSSMIGALSYLVFGDYCLGSS